MSMRKINMFICMSVIVLLWSNSYVYAQTVDAKVLSCTEKEISLELSSQATFQVGDTIDVGYIVGSMGESLIGTYKVTSLNNKVVGAEVIRSVIPASQGMNVVVYPSTEQPFIDNLFSQDYAKKTQAVDIGNIQKSLKGLGYNLGEINGQPSKQTESAIRAFQKDTGLPVDGKITQGLADSLYQELNSFDRYLKEKEAARKSHKDTATTTAAQSAGSETRETEGKSDFGDAFENF